MIQFDLDEISAIERNACIDSIAEMMESFAILIDDIEAALSRRQADGVASELVDAVVAMDMV